MVNVVGGLNFNRERISQSLLRDYTHTILHEKTAAQHTDICHKLLIFGPPKTGPHPKQDLNLEKDQDTCCFSSTKLCIRLEILYMKKFGGFCIQKASKEWDSNPQKSCEPQISSIQQEKVSVHISNRGNPRPLNEAIRKSTTNIDPWNICTYWQKTTSKIILRSSKE